MPLRFDYAYAAYNENIERISSYYLVGLYKPSSPIASFDKDKVTNIWKINLGIRVISKEESLRFELSYLSDVGLIFGIYAGIGF